MHRVVFISSGVLLLGLALSIGSPRDGLALQQRGTWRITTTKLPDAKAGGWFINLGITGARARIRSEAPRALEVAYVFEGTPAFGELEVGDRITGANGRPFVKAHEFGSALESPGYEGPMRDFGMALEESQGQLGGRLALDVTRGGTRRRIVLGLPTENGAFSATYPHDCRKTDRILDELRAYLRARQRPDGLWHDRPHTNAFAALALLGSGDDEHLPATRRAARAMAQHTTSTIDHDGPGCWSHALYGITLAEYFLLTRERWVLPELEEINRWLHDAQLSSGGWGHRPGFGLVQSGYGGINVITMQAKLAWALMTRCGLKVDPAKRRATHEFVSRGTNRLGYVRYRDGGRDNSWCADMGRTGASALAHHLTPSGGESYRRVALSNARCIGHFPKTFPDTRGSPLLGMVWTALGALPDPAMLRKLLDANRWHFALARCPDGTFYYQPNRDGSPQEYIADPRLCASAVTALILSVKHRRLQITGAEPIELPPAVIDNVAPVETVSEPPVDPTPTRPTDLPTSGALALPGLKIDLENDHVDVEATVCLDHGSLELVACTRGSKEHESIVTVAARPMHVHTALLLLGAQSGHPAMRKRLGEKKRRWIELAPRGDPIRVSLVFKGSGGKVVERPIADFIALANGQLPDEFVFAGSQRPAGDSSPRRYLADLSGHIISLATFGDELLCLPGVQGQDGGAPPWRVDATLLPAVGTSVTLRLRPRKDLDPTNASTKAPERP